MKSLFETKAAMCLSEQTDREKSNAMALYDEASGRSTNNARHETRRDGLKKRKEYRIHKKNTNLC